MPGIGRYIKQRDKDFGVKSFVYLKIIGMRHDFSTKKPYFDFKALTKSKTESRTLESKLPSENRKVFSAIESERLIEIFEDIGE